MNFYTLVIALAAPFLMAAQTTYTKDIAPIIKKHCIACHAQGEIGPMPFETYAEVASYASMIKFVTSTKLMPPFKADPHKVAYKNERSISQEEITKIEEWINGGLLEGVVILSDTLSSNTVAEYDEIICMHETFEHYGIYYDQYQAFVLPLSNPDVKYVSKVDVLPGNKEIVRSVNLSIAAKGDANAMDAWDPRYGFYAYGSLGFEPTLPNWYSWMPNTPEIQLSEKEFNIIPANAEMIVHVHYGPYGQVESDSTCVGMIYAKENPRIQLQNVPLIATEFLSDSFLLEAGLKKRFSSSFYIPEDTYIRSVTPLSHLLCKSWEVFAVLPDKSTMPLLSISDWDFHWREKYVFADYILLPKGSKIIATAIYDNTAQNPYNPSDPPRGMKKGPHMFDENHLCYFEMLNPIENPTAVINKPFTVTTSKIEEVKFQCQKEADYALTIHDLSNNTSVLLSEKSYPVGDHIIKSSVLPNKPGRYSISISMNDQHQDAWYFVVKLSKEEN